MKYGYVGRSNMIVSKICLGGMHFGDKTSKEETFAILDRAFDLGINFIDTADVYNEGRSESYIGEWLAQDKSRRDKMVIATKFYGHLQPGEPNEEVGVSLYKCRRSLEGSLRRLQTDHVDIYQSHHIDKRITDEEYWEMMHRNIMCGKVLYAGGCNSTGWSLAEQQMAAKHLGYFGLASEQSNYSLLNRFVELEVIPAAQRFGIGVLAFMTLAGGILSGKKKAAPGSRTEFVTREYDYDMENNAQLEAFSRLCAELGEKENVVASAWVLHNPAVTSAIVGARTVAHLDDVERIVELKLPQDFLDELDKIFTYSNGRPLRPNTDAPFAYSGLGSHEDHFIQYYRNDRRLDHQVLHLELDEGDKI